MLSTPVRIAMGCFPLLNVLLRLRLVFQNPGFHKKLADNFFWVALGISFCSFIYWGECHQKRTPLPILLLHMGLLDFIKTADPRKVRAVEVQKGDDQEGVAEEDAYLELADPDEGTTMVRQGEEEVVTERSKKAKKRSLKKQSDVLPAKGSRNINPALDSRTLGQNSCGWKD
ncbi:hypothetical protein Tco_0965421 [Tanacetum coccineum]